MKKIIYIAFIILFASCNNENAGDCFQTAGKIIQVEIEVPIFEKVVVHERIELIITQGNEQKVIVESGKNLLSDISVEVINNQLILINNNTCNFFRDYDLTKVYITSPNLTVIRNASEYNVSSTGTLTYPSLYLRSSGEKSEFLSIGDWHLNIKNESIKIWSNGIAIFYLEGSTTNLDLVFSDGNTRFEGKNFKVQNIKVSQVSSNDILIFPIESLTGSIHSTGDIISFNTPPIVNIDIQSNYGELLFK
jgi:hypothetical protein